MTNEVLIAGGGIGGLAAAVAAARAGWKPRVFEQAHAFGEIGAGIQLGPNAVKWLQAWEMGDGLRQVASFPDGIRVRRAADGVELAQLSLADFPPRYGAPYCTVHRADLHALLLRAATALGVPMRLGVRVDHVRHTDHAVQVRAGEVDCEGEALVAADGVWSALRAHVGASEPPRFTGDVAYRALARQADLPPELRSHEVTAWLGRGLHAVAYPLRGGEWLNVVLVTGASRALDRDWDQQACAADLQAAIGGTAPALRGLLEAVGNWRTWPLYGTRPLRSPHAMAEKRVALLGDAAHPMRPYLAQGAGMAIEDAAELGRMLSMASACELEVPLALRRYALNRWERCARVQARARRNGTIFHAGGPLQWGRDLALRMLGPRLLDLPWLYRGA